jgi:hypothetical protein
MGQQSHSFWTALGDTISPSQGLRTGVIYPMIIRLVPTDDGIQSHQILLDRAGIQPNFITMILIKAHSQNDWTPP